MRLSPTDRSWDWVPYGVAVLGLLMGGVTAIEIAAMVGQPGGMNPVFVAGVITSLPVSVGLVGGGWWLRGSSIPTVRFKRIAGWTLALWLFFVSFTAVIAASVTAGLQMQVATLRWGSTIGAGSGFLVGIFEARSIEQAVVAQRIRAEEIERRRELLEYLNGILRHEVLNTATVIEGYADLLETAAGDREAIREYSRVIEGEAKDLTTVTDDVMGLLETADAGGDRGPVDLASVLDEELSDLRERYPAVSVERSVPEDVWVRADALVGRLFSNLLENAVAHNEGPARVEVGVSPGEDIVTVVIEDNGTGVPEAEREHLFERTTRTDTSHGMGLSIVDMLADRYDGDVALAETGPDGSVFEVELPRARPGE